MRLIKSFFTTIKTKGFTVALLAIINFFKILIVKAIPSFTYLKKKIFDYKMYLDPRDKGISRTLLLFGERELDHRIILKKVLSKNMKVFDIGANIGYYVLMESSILGINGRIAAVEPVPKNMHLLKKNLELNKNNIEYKAINACISFLPFLNGKQLLVVENLISNACKRDYLKCQKITSVFFKIKITVFTS